MSVTRSGALVADVVSTWRVLREHSEGCVSCRGPVRQLAQVPDDWPGLRDGLCSEGTPLFDAWGRARSELSEAMSDPDLAHGGSESKASDAAGRFLHSLQQQRIRLGIVGLSEADAEVRAQALERLTADQFQALLAVEPAEARENQIRALEAAIRRGHEVVEVRCVGLSATGKSLFGWFCACGAAEAGYYSAQDARAGAEAHGGEEGSMPRTRPDERECAYEDCRRGPDETRARFVPPKHSPNKRYCSGACREAGRRSRQDQEDDDG